LCEVAADFHQVEVLSWWFRDADSFAKEVFVGFAIRRHLADALLAVLVDGFKPWLAVEAAAKWTPTREFVFGPAPEGFWPGGGWFTNSKRETRGIRAMEGRWTRRQTGSELRNESEVTEVVLPCGVTGLAGDALRGYAMLRSLTIQPGCVTIEDGTLWNTKTRRWDGAMAGCSSLVTATIPSTCATIGAFAFTGCSGLTELVIPSSVTTIGSSAFNGCSGLVKLVIALGVRIIGNAALRGCSGLTELVIPSSLTSVGNGAFHGCSGLTRLVIPSSVTIIGHGAFRGCSGLSGLVIPSSVGTIGKAAFRDCSGLRHLAIPASLAGIGDSHRGVFSGVKLDRVTLVGSPLGPAVVANLDPALAPGARVMSAALAGQRFGRFAIVAA
jgi:hypothetical protein